ncbi:helix-hairpin-helix domain-containing protein [Streptomyces sp. NPDC015346]|uniref:helix-hairpin-helix domain-containing protein n=1 Tax=Streptomyces sp. NPDC015346 TaxID=3364954 RepID=UPI0037004935
MALRTHVAGRIATTTAPATSGPGRAPGSDGRTRSGGRGSPPARARRRARVRHASVTAGTSARRRADALFPPREAEAPASPGPPVEWSEPDVAASDGHRAQSAAPGRWERLRLAVRDRLPVWAQSRCGLEPRTLAALAVVLVVAAGFAGRYFWTGRPEVVRAPEIVRAAPPEIGPTSPASPVSSAPPGGFGGATEPTAGAPPEVVVDVSGKVRRPGVLTLPAGSRVADALRAAGGVRPGTDVTGLNRARVLMDGEQVVVGLPLSTAPGLGAGAGGGGGVGSAGGGRAAPLSLNAATVEQLDTLPGVGPVLAQHIVDHRTEHGGFRTVAELREVNGIGERRFADLAPLVRP